MSPSRNRILIYIYSLFTNCSIYIHVPINPFILLWPSTAIHKLIHPWPSALSTSCCLLECCQTDGSNYKGCQKTRGGSTINLDSYSTYVQRFRPPLTRHEKIITISWCSENHYIISLNSLPDIYGQLILFYFHYTDLGYMFTFIFLKCVFYINNTNISIRLWDLICCY